MSDTTKEKGRKKGKEKGKRFRPQPGIIKRASATGALTIPSSALREIRVERGDHVLVECGVDEDGSICLFVRKVTEKCDICSGELGNPTLVEETGAVLCEKCVEILRERGVVE